MNDKKQPVITEQSNYHKSKLTIVSKPIDSEYSMNLWFIVSGAVECGGMGGDTWGFRCHPSSSWKDYNDARENGYTSTYPSAIVRLESEEHPECDSEYHLINAQWLHNRLVRFVNDEKMPMHLRKQYGAMLVTREYPEDADACSDDAVMQHFFTKKIIYG